MIYFSWDSRKAELSLQKHSVSFEEAESVFDDPNGLLPADDRNSYNEDRFVLLGFSSSAKMIVVAHCYRESDSEIRIISARKASKNEQRQYMERLS